ncbi:VOC family protein [Marinobacterium rhizophilum]|uniref:VOC family protein n=1 Tax=Marinobacterium rhizophilum TaxID=420402 RepID=UPI0003739DE1|nr:VOC family protein [Marinobacterium rhizophilum]
MNRQSYINLPVKQLDRAIDFFSHLGFTFNPQFSDASATCMVVSSQMSVMLLTEERFQAFSPKNICDSSTFSEVLICLTCESREEVDALVTRALSGGGSTYNEPQDHGFMYGHGFQDLDGHIWELIYMAQEQVG